MIYSPVYDHIRYGLYDQCDQYDLMIYAYGRYMTCTCDVYSLVYMIFI